MPNYIVHSRHDTTVSVPAKAPDGADIVGLYPASIIELVPVDDFRKSIEHLELTHTPDLQAAVATKFAVGNTVSLNGFDLVSPTS